MKKISFWFILFLIASLLGCNGVSAKKTVVYIVRHAEKATSDTTNENPVLSPEGKQRAKDLAAALKNEKLSAVFSTKYKRNKQTAAPAAQQAGLPLIIYEGHYFAGIHKTVTDEYSGKKVLITGHSNTVLELVEAFGARRPVKQLSDDDYDLLFTITIRNNGKADLKTKRYGKPHHTTNL